MMEETAPSDSWRDALRHGWQRHQAGDLASARQIYREVLQRDPGNPHALNLLGRVAFEEGRPDVAVECMRHAAAAAPDTAAFHHNLGLALVSAGRLEEATACFRTAVGLKPDYAEAYNNLANVLDAQGEHDEAVACYRQAISLRPDSADFCNNLGIALADHGDHLDALACFLAAGDSSSSVPDQTGSGPQA